MDRISNGGVPSIAVAVAKDGAIILEEASGWSDAELHLHSAGARVRVAQQDHADAEIPTGANRRHPCRDRLAVRREEDRLFGAVTSVGQWEARAGPYELSSRVEFGRSKDE